MKLPQPEADTGQPHPLVSVSLIFSLFVASITLPSTAALLHQSWVFRERGGADATRERAFSRGHPEPLRARGNRLPTRKDLPGM
jgi:hypothetical protein